MAMNLNNVACIGEVRNAYKILKGEAATWRPKRLILGTYVALLLKKLDIFKGKAFVVSVTYLCSTFKPRGYFRYACNVSYILQAVQI
jgi:hypothetical protein